METLILLNEWEKACTIGQQAKEFYPDEIAFDFKLAGCYAALGKSIERDYFLQNVRLNKSELSKKLPLFSPI